MTTNFDRFCPFDLEWDIPGWGCGFEFAPLILNLDDSKEDHLEQVKRFFRAERPEMIEELENVKSAKSQKAVVPLVVGVTLVSVPPPALYPVPLTSLLVE